MKIEINIDEQKLQEKVTELVAKAFLSQYSNVQYIIKNAVEKAVNEVVTSEKSNVLEMAIEKAAVKLAYGDIPEVVERV